MKAEVSPLSSSSGGRTETVEVHADAVLPGGQVLPGAVEETALRRLRSPLAPPTVTE